MVRRLVKSVLVLALLLSHASPAIARRDEGLDATAMARSGPSTGAIAASMAQMPLYFIENGGQADPRVAYYVAGQDKTVYFAADGVTFVLNDESRSLGPSGRWPYSANQGDDPRSLGPCEVLVPFQGGRWPYSANPGEGDRSSDAHKRLGYGNPAPAPSYVLKLDFLGANPDVVPVGEEPTGAVISYFRGSQSEWKTGLPTFSRIAYRNLWPGIDLVYSATVDHLKYVFVVAPGADPSQIRLAYRGADSVTLTADGRLAVSTPAGGFEDDVPVACQEGAGGERAAVEVGYKVESNLPGSSQLPGRWDGDTLTPTPGTAPGLRLSPSVLGARGADAYSFSLGPYDHTLPIIIDPAVRIYCGYIGGSDNDEAKDVAVDANGCAYIVGTTSSLALTFPERTGPDLTNDGLDDVFVAKVNRNGTALVWCGYIGGEAYDEGECIAVDGEGCAYVGGWTTGDDADGFPVSGGPDLTANGLNDGFVAKVAADGTALLYCGFVGGSDDDTVWGIAVDQYGCAFISGSSRSDTTEGFPRKAGPSLTHGGGHDAFAARLKASPVNPGVLDNYHYCGYIGGTGDDWGKGVAILNGCAFVVGNTTSNETTGHFPVLGGPDLTYNLGIDAFVAEVKADGSGLWYCGYIGGSGPDEGNDIAVDSFGCAYVGGETSSSQATFPVVGGPDLTIAAYSDAFVAKVRANASGLIYCGYLGGGGFDSINSVALDSKRGLLVTGGTESDADADDFPVISGPDLTFNGGTSDAFVARVRPDPTNAVFIFNLEYCGYIGGSDDEEGEGIAVDSQQNAYVAGSTYSSHFSFPVTQGPDVTWNGLEDGFVAKVAADPPPQVGDATPHSGTVNVAELTYFYGSYSDADGYEDLKWAILCIGSAPTLANTAYLCYSRSSGKLVIRSDDGSVWWGGRAPLSDYWIHNLHAAQVYCKLTQVTSLLTQTTVRWAVQFNTEYTGAKNVYMRAVDISGHDTGMVYKGTITIVDP